MRKEQVEVCSLWLFWWDLLGGTHWRGQHSFEDGSFFVFFSCLEFATFLALVLARRWEGVTVRDSLGPLLSLVSLLVEEGKFI